MYKTPRHKDPIFTQIEDQIAMSRPHRGSHFFSGTVVNFSVVESQCKGYTDQTPPDQNFWDEKAKTKQFALRS